MPFYIFLASLDVWLSMLLPGGPPKNNKKYGDNHASIPMRSHTHPQRSTIIYHHIPSYTIIYHLSPIIWWYMMNYDDIWWYDIWNRMKRWNRKEKLCKKSSSECFKRVVYGTALKIIQQNAWIPHRRLLDPSFDSWVTWVDLTNPWLRKASAASAILSDSLWVTDWVIGSPVLTMFAWVIGFKSTQYSSHPRNM